MDYDKIAHGMTEWEGSVTKKDSGGDEWLITLTEKSQLSLEQAEV